MPKYKSGTKAYEMESKYYQDMIEPKKSWWKQLKELFSKKKMNVVTEKDIVDMIEKFPDEPKTQNYYNPYFLTPPPINESIIDWPKLKKESPIPPIFGNIIFGKTQEEEGRRFLSQFDFYLDEYGKLKIREKEKVNEKEKGAQAKEIEAPKKRRIEL